MPESPRNFIKQHAIRDWVVKWSFGPPKPEKLPLGTTDGYRYSIVKRAAGPQEAIRIWRERTLPEYAPVTDREPIVHKVYIYTDKMGTLGEARRVVEAEDAKRFLRQASDMESRLPPLGYSKHRFTSGSPYYLRQMGPFLFQVEPRGYEIVVSYYRKLESTGKWDHKKVMFARGWHEAFTQLKEWGALEADHYRNGGVTDDAPAPMREAENAKDILRQATAARAKLIHCFKDFHFLRSIPRPDDPAMLMALHALQSKECEMAEQHVFTVLDLQAGYAFHQSARRTDPTHFWTERMWKSVAGESLSDPSFESLASQIR